MFRAGTQGRILSKHEQSLLPRREKKDGERFELTHGITLEH